MLTPSVDMDAVAAEGAMSLRARVERVLSQGGRAVGRLGAAGTSVTFLVTDGSAEPVTLLLDREPPQISDDENAEITVEMDPHHAREFMHGRLVLSTCLIEGKIHSTGPIRKYLAVDPILRGLLAAIDRADLDAGDR